ncbi:MULTISPECIES: hypothetical protein [Spiroplasma]|uniref:Uncharacterized protein n=1 Tax=Spiroplasma eriocheiris TaxID=315358 RepID=A0A0H3XM86_9MOLU|nr:hypothetical protein [Spiroplasma eriocheiris]AKM54002.1 hypothetical protein SERIO_v1c04230 [Spiroplasma eriocheiris]
MKRRKTTTVWELKNKRFRNYVGFFQSLTYLFSPNNFITYLTI